MERLGAEEDLDDQRRGPVLFYITVFPSLDVVSVLVRLIDVEVEPAIYSLGISLLGVGGSELDAGLQDDEGRLGVEVLDDLIESLHLDDGFVRRLVLTS